MTTVDEDVAKVHRGDDLAGSVRENTTSLCTSVSLCFFSAEPLYSCVPPVVGVHQPVEVSPNSGTCWSLQKK